jgi:monofunctional biosynthetic peptidoglycan transglycosylase
VRFYEHSGIDWKQVELVAAEALESGEALRGASTITRQLIRNLRIHYRTSAARLGREQAARHAAILPSPRRRKPARMNGYSAIIQARMAQMGW